MSTEQNSYIQNLTFEEKLKKSPYAWYIGNIRIVILVLLVVLGLGTYSFLNLPRELNPSIDITIITVSTSLPGASPEDVESLITKPIEDELDSVDDVDTITSTSRPSVSSIVIQFDSGVSTDKAKQDVQSAVDGVTGLPEDATDPAVSEIDFEDTPVWTFALSAGTDIPGLNRFAERLQDRLEEDSAIDRVEIAGRLNREIQIIVKPEVIRDKSLNPQQLSQAISNSLSSYPAGELETGDSSLSLTIDPGIEDIADIRDTKLSLQGETYTISEIATVIESASPGQAKAFKSSPDEDTEPIVTFDVYKLNGTTINDAATAAQDIVAEQTAGLDHFQYTTVIDYSQEINDQFSSLGRNFLQTVLLVFLVMFFFLGIREAFLSSLSIPLAVMISFSVMWFTGITLNFISIFSLLLALGLLVDNAIVVVSAVNSYYRAGKFTAYETGLLVFKDFFVPLLATNITTVWAFLPLVLATGVIGEFIEPIPIIVSATIIASAFVGFFLTLPIALTVLSPHIPKRVKVLFGVLVIALLTGLIISLTSPIGGAVAGALPLPQGPATGIISGIITFILAVIVLVSVIALFFSFPKVAGVAKKRSDVYLNRHQNQKNRIGKVGYQMNHGFISLGKLGMRYKRYMYGILSSRLAQWKVLIVIGSFFIFAILMVAFGFVQNIFFPPEDTDIVYVSIELPSGTSIQTSEAEAIRFMPNLQDTQELRFITSRIGAPPPNSDKPAGNNLILYTLRLTDPEERNITSIEIAQQLREEFAGYTKGEISVVEQAGGPPAGSDIQIKYLGPDLELLNDYARKTREYLDQQDNVTNIAQSITSGTSKISFIPDEKKLAEYGISEADLGLWLRSFASGFTLDELEVGDEDYDIVFRLSGGTETPDDLNAVTVPTSRGPVPLNALGNTVLRTNPNVITREDGKRTISVTASVTEGGNTGQIGQRLEQWADNELGLDPGYSWETGGVNEENQESLNSIFQAMALSAVLILLTLVIQLGSFRKSVIVMLVIPLAVSGVLILFALLSPLGLTLSFPAMIGMLALFGIVVNNSILIVEKINQNIAAGFDLKESIADACASRLEPIALTTMTTIIGLLPITLSDALWRDLGGAIICGLAFSGILMLFFIPTVYWMWMATPEDKKGKNDGNGILVKEVR